MQKNILNTALEDCGLEPITGFFRNGRCESCDDDVGQHTICVKMSAEFLKFSKQQGNDLSTPREELDFPGLKPGDRWCVCLGRWLDALEAGVAPPLYPRATHRSVLEYVPIEVLEKHSVKDS